MTYRVVVRSGEGYAKEEWDIHEYIISANTLDEISRKICSRLSKNIEILSIRKV